MAPKGGTPGQAPRKADGQPHPGLQQGQALVIKSRNGQLHLAIVVPLVAASLLAIVVPITRTHASSRTSPPTAVSAAGDGLALAMQSQALAVASALSQPGSANAASAAYATQLQTLPAHELLPQELLTAVSRAAARGVLVSGHPGSRAVAQPPVPFTVHTSGLTVSQTSSKTTV